MFVKLTKVSVVTFPLTEVASFPLDAIPLEFPEFANLAPNFEAYRFHRMKVRVFPHANVGNNTTSKMSTYCLLPWHQPIPTGGSFETYLSLDKAKIFRDFNVGKQIYNLNTLIATKAGTDSELIETAWNKRIELTGDTAYTVRHYGGLMAFQEVKNAPEKYSVDVTIIRDVYCTFYNQRTLK